MNHRYSPETLELFKVFQFGIENHLDLVTNADDLVEIGRVRRIFAEKNTSNQQCKECEESMKTHGSVCYQHWHDYINQGEHCCWTCYVQTVHEEQLGVYLD